MQNIIEKLTLEFHEQILNINVVYGKVKTEQDYEGKCSEFGKTWNY